MIVSIINLSKVNSLLLPHVRAQKAPMTLLRYKVGNGLMEGVFLNLRLMGLTRLCLLSEQGNKQ